MNGKLSFTGRIASFSFRHKWYVLAAWLILLVASGVAASGLGSVLTQEQKDLSNSDSAQAKQIVDDRFGERPLVETLVVRSETDTVDSPAFQSLVAGLTGQLRETEGVAQVTSYLDTNDPNMISADRHAATARVTLVGDINEAEKSVKGPLEVVNATSLPQGYQLHLIGDASANSELNKIVEEDLAAAEMIGLPVALAVMVLAFGTVIAAFVPLLMAMAAILPAVGSVALIGQVFELSFFVTNIITMIGLAVGIDYSLFIIGRYREELGKGRSAADALGIAADSSGRAVFFSGITVLLALAGMLLVRTNIFVSIGIGAMVVVLYAVAASLTLLPALLGVLGRGINWVRIPFLGKAGYGARFWGAVTNRVQARPVLFAVGSTALLLAAALPLATIDLGAAGLESLPKETATYQGFTALQQDFSTGLVAPMQVVVEGDLTSPSVQQGIARFQTAVEARPGLQWVGVTPSDDRSAAIIEVASSASDTSEASLAVVDNLRTQIVPQAFQGSGATVHVGGNLPGFVDAKSEMDSKLPVVFGFVLGLSFLLLLVVFRSIAIPTKAIIMNLLSVGAAYGLIVLVFQHGFLAEQLGFQQTPQVEFWLPLFLFSILFGLSMDYHVFLLSRIKEEFTRTGDNRRAVAVGVKSTAGMITSAAIIMVAVFAAFSRGSMVSLQQMGFGLAVAVFLDATIIRSVLVPASMQLLGRYNWWMPSWLGWLPRLNVEGSHAVPALAGAGDD